MLCVWLLSGALSAKPLLLEGSAAAGLTTSPPQGAKKAPSEQGDKKAPSAQGDKKPAAPAKPGQGEAGAQGAKKAGESPGKAGKSTGQAAKQDARKIAIPTDQRRGRKLFVSLGDCLKLGDSANLELGLKRIEELLAVEDRNVAEAFFEPELFATAGWTNTESPPRNAFQPSTTSDVYTASVGLRKRFVTGGSLEIAFSPVYVDQRVNSQFAFPSTVFRGDTTFTLSQPILRGAWWAYNEADIEAARQERIARAADYERSRQTLLDQIVAAYYDLVFTREDYVVRFQSLELSREQLANTIRQIELGELAPRDKVADQADVAKKEEELILAENAILDAGDVLKRFVLPFREQREWSFVVVPTEQLGDSDPNLAVPSLDEAYRTARRGRSDLFASASRVEAARQRLQKADKDRLPQLDLSATYRTQAQREDFPAFNADIWEAAFPEYSLQLSFTLPLGNLAARSRHRQARLNLESAERGRQILLADIDKEVRAALRNVETARKTIAASRESVRLALSNLEAERIRLGLGDQTQFEVQRRNQEHQDARSRLLRARLDYRIAWFRLLAALGGLGPDARLPSK